MRARTNFLSAIARWGDSRGLAQQRVACSCADTFTYVRIRMRANSPLASHGLIVASRVVEPSRECIWRLHSDDNKTRAPSPADRTRCGARCHRARLAATKHAQSVSR